MNETTDTKRQIDINNIQGLREELVFWHFNKLKLPNHLFTLFATHASLDFKYYFENAWFVYREYYYADNKVKLFKSWGCYEDTRN